MIVICIRPFLRRNVGLDQTPQDPALSARPSDFSISELYVQHESWLRGWLRRRLGCSHTAEDLAHDTFLRVLKKREREALQRPRAYLGTIARGLLINRWRRQEIERTYMESLAQQPEPTADSPEQREVVLETLFELDALLERLPAKTRAAFFMAQLDGLTYSAIAERLGVTERTVKNYMARAMFCCLVAGGDGT